MKRKSEFERFDEAMKAILSVSHKDLQEKIAAEKQRSKRKRPKTVASREASDRA